MSPKRQVGLHGAKETRIGKPSGSEQRRLGFGRCLAPDPDLFIFEYPVWSEKGRERAGGDRPSLAEPAGARQCRRSGRFGRRMANWLLRVLGGPCSVSDGGLKLPGGGESEAKPDGRGSSFAAEASAEAGVPAAEAAPPRLWRPPLALPTLPGMLRLQRLPAPPGTRSPERTPMTKAFRKKRALGPQGLSP